ncbi:uncharacterized protein EI90DRAFT_3119630 [Cantharellus anzutake]|uniref:uncharacterized protein n=1 Tax=Cantharellus anzutake TaxID=1750568 RepID=UPI0019062C92|nr:uncharacterized protein EI90DRAFT_3119630 [Cantharellus anzutake]KAF8336338.1 hypothetical protein EI90DRAFT_3119630 [Cantharellus anzutake]
MAKASGGALAAQITLGGGFGFISTGYQNVEFAEKEIEIARSLLSSSQFNNSISTRLPIGVGFFGWELEQRPEAVQVLEYVLRRRDIRALWLSCGRDLPRWIKTIREADSNERTLIFVQVNTTPEAIESYTCWDIDVLVVQGNEAGGHGLGIAPPLVTLLPSILAAVEPLRPLVHGPLPILGAGGIATGSQVAAILTLGASGAVIGTSLTVSPESLIPESKKETLLNVARNFRIDDNPTIRSPIFDDLMGVADKWPDGITGRGLRMKAMLDDEVSGISMGARRERYEAGKGSGGTHEIIWSGTSIGLRTEPSFAADLIRELHEEAIRSIKEASGLLAD